jgi:superfamily I DNA/RNA helicase
MEETWWADIEKLDDSQKEVISLNMNGNFLVIGPPGSGKTNLLVMRAKYLHANNMKNFVVLTVGRVLREFLVMGADQYTFPPERIQTYISWAKNLLESNGVNVDSEGEFDDVRESILQGLKKLAEAGNLEDRFDCILLDEAQDYSSAEIEVISSFADRVFAVGDERQRIYSQSGGLDALKAYCDEVKILPHHYRNGIDICKVADGIRNHNGTSLSLETNCNYVEDDNPSTVEDFSGLSLENQVAKCIDFVRDQLRAYPLGLIGILCPKNADVNEVARLIGASNIRDEVQVQNSTAGYHSFDAEKRVVITTIHGAKGLEFRALHLLAMDNITKFKTQKNMAFTAVSRAKTSLTIYSGKELPGYLQKGLSLLTVNLQHPVSAADLFKARG